MGKGAFSNRHARRSGGNRPVKITVWPSGQSMLSVSIQCFENRHTECFGWNELFGHQCECECHERSKSDD